MLIIWPSFRAAPRSRDNVSANLVNRSDPPNALGHLLLGIRLAEECSSRVCIAAQAHWSLQSLAHETCTNTSCETSQMPHSANARGWHRSFTGITIELLYSMVLDGSYSCVSTRITKFLEVRAWSVCVSTEDTDSLSLSGWIGDFSVNIVVFVAEGIWLEADGAVLPNWIFVSCFVFVSGNSLCAELMAIFCLIILWLPGLDKIRSSTNSAPCPTRAKSLKWRYWDMTSGVNAFNCSALCLSSYVVWAQMSSRYVTDALQARDDWLYKQLAQCTGYLLIINNYIAI